MQFSPLLVQSPSLAAIRVPGLKDLQAFESDGVAGLRARVINEVSATYPVEIHRLRCLWMLYSFELTRQMPKSARFRGLRMYAVFRARSCSGEGYGSLGRH